MSGAGRPPIPTAFGQRLIIWRMSLFPLLVFGVAICFVAFLWRNHLHAPVVIGPTEKTLANVTVHQSGVVVGLRVTPQQRVRAGEQLAGVMVADPKSVSDALTALRAELQAARSKTNSSDGVERVGSQTHVRLNHLERRAELAVARVNLYFAEVDYQKALARLEENPACAAEVSARRAVFEAAGILVAELSRAVYDECGSVAPSMVADGNSATASSLAVLAEYENRLRTIEAELNLIPLYAPFDGIVTAVHARTGEAVSPGKPVITITADASEQPGDEGSEQTSPRQKAQS